MRFGLSLFLLFVVLVEGSGSSERLRRINTISKMQRFNYDESTAAYVLEKSVRRTSPQNIDVQIVDGMLSIEITYNATSKETSKMSIPDGADANSQPVVELFEDDSGDRTKMKLMISVPEIPLSGSTRSTNSARLNSQQRNLSSASSRDQLPKSFIMKGNTCFLEFPALKKPTGISNIRVRNNRILVDLNYVSDNGSVITTSVNVLIPANCEKKFVKGTNRQGTVVIRSTVINNVNSGNNSSDNHVASNFGRSNNNSGSSTRIGKKSSISNNSQNRINSRINSMNSNEPTSDLAILNRMIDQEFNTLFRFDDNTDKYILNLIIPSLSNLNVKSATGNDGSPTIIVSGSASLKTAKTDFSKMVSVPGIGYTNVTTKSHGDNVTMEISKSDDNDGQENDDTNNVESHIASESSDNVYGASNLYDNNGRNNNGRNNNGRNNNGRNNSGTNNTNSGINTISYSSNVGPSSNNHSRNRLNPTAISRQSVPRNYSAQTNSKPPVAPSFTTRQGKFSGGMRNNTDDSSENEIIQWDDHYSDGMYSVPLKLPDIDEDSISANIVVEENKYVMNLSANKTIKEDNRTVIKKYSLQVRLPSDINLDTTYLRKINNVWHIDVYRILLREDLMHPVSIEYM